METIRKQHDTAFSSKRKAPREFEKIEGRRKTKGIRGEQWDEKNVGDVSGREADGGGKSRVEN